MLNVSACSLWLQEYQDNNKDIVISNSQPSQTVYIYSCKNTIVQVKGKINSMVVGKYIFVNLS